MLSTTKFLFLRTVFACHRLLLLIHQFLQPNVNAQQSFATLPCADMPGTSTLYMDPSVLLPGNRQTINAPIATCPTCLNQFYYAPNPSKRPNNGMGLATPAQQDNPSAGFAEKIVCPNWCACSTTQCVQNINTNLYLYPVCNAATGACGMIFYGTIGSGAARCTPSGAICLNPLPFVPGVMFSDQSMNFAGRGVSSVSCNGCVYAPTCLTTTTSTTTTTTTTTTTPTTTTTTTPTTTTQAPSDTMVRVINETRPRRMDQLKRGDWVLAVSTDNGEPAFSRIDWWIHRSPTTMAEFRRLELDNGVVLKLTAKHFIYKRANCSSSSEFVPETGKAEFLHMRVESVRTVTEKGIYAPMTSEGNILVEGVVASCFTLLDSLTWHQSYYNLMTLSPWIGRMLGADLESDEEVGLPNGLLSAMKMIKTWYGSDD
ncbi:hint module domain-containing protein [Ditylenchus destructor]|uniref:Hint module domain-containing protein n=1 Tax=Ditylenchus destructor TaxID=166010 RepID=A0AAD4MR91_9BILA|nr:hint module domain-containing protein [Ditylenchus destructor]